MNYKICEIIKESDGLYIVDYRIKGGRIRFIKGRKSDLSEVFCYSDGLGDLLGCISNIDETMTVVKYGKKYAIGSL